MVDYKKKYLKYKKKYLAIKKLKGGGMHGWEVPTWRALGDMASYVRAGTKEVGDGVFKFITHGAVHGEKESRYSGKTGRKTFNIFKSNASTQFDARMYDCENSTPHDLLSMGGFEHDLDRFVLIKREERKHLVPSDYTSRPGGAQIIKYTNKKKNPDVDIYSDHEAICMPLYTGVPDNYKKLITMNLEGFCWGNGDNPQNFEWEDKNQQRLDNVLDLLNPYISPLEDGPPISRGNIFLFQEVVLKGAANFEIQEKKSLIRFRNALYTRNPYYVLVHDGCTGAILYDRRRWSLRSVINIDRRFVDYRGDVEGPNDVIKKKSNG